MWNTVLHVAARLHLSGKTNIISSLQVQCSANPRSLGWIYGNLVVVDNFLSFDHASLACLSRRMRASYLEDFLKVKIYSSIFEID